MSERNPKNERSPMNKCKPKTNLADAEESFDDNDQTCDCSDKKASLSDIDCLYESKDEKLAVFETKEGHLVAVDASKLV